MFFLLLLCAKNTSAEGDMRMRKQTVARQFVFLITIKIGLFFLEDLVKSTRFYIALYNGIVALRIIRECGDGRASQNYNPFVYFNLKVVLWPITVNSQR